MRRLPSSGQRALRTYVTEEKLAPHCLPIAEHSLAAGHQITPRSFGANLVPHKVRPSRQPLVPCREARQLPEIPEACSSICGAPRTRSRSPVRRPAAASLPMPRPRQSRAAGGAASVRPRWVTCRPAMPGESLSELWPMIFREPWPHRNESHWLRQDHTSREMRGFARGKVPAKDLGAD